MTTASPLSDLLDEPVAPARSAPSVRARVTALWALFPMAVAGALFWYRAADRQMWNNEYATWHAATLALRDLRHLMVNTDLVHAAYYLFMHGLIKLFGDLPIVLRAPSLIAMALTCGVTTLVGRRLANAPVGVMAGLIVAALPSVSRYAQEARSYALVTLGAVLATLLLLRALERPTRTRWALYVTCLVAVGLLHFVALIVLAAHLLLVFRSTDRDDAKRWQWVIAVGIMGLGLVPLLSLAARQSASISWIKADIAAVRAFPTALFGSTHVAIAVAAAGLLGMVLFWRADSARAGLLIVWAVLPPVFGYATFSALHLFLPRYFLFTLPAWAILASATVLGIGRVFSRTSRLTWIIPAVLLLPGLCYLAYPAQLEVRRSPVAGQPDYRGAMLYIRAQQLPGDGMVFNDVFGQLSDLAREAADYELRSGPRPRDVFVATTAAEAGSFSARECVSPHACLGTTPRLWLVTTNYSTDPLSGMKEAYAGLLTGRFSPAGEKKFAGVRVVLFLREQ